LGHGLWTKVGKEIRFLCSFCYQQRNKNLISCLLTLVALAYTLNSPTLLPYFSNPGFGPTQVKDLWIVSTQKYVFHDIVFTMGQEFCG
jgi:hypothetical protein